jgi:flagellar protein FlbD
MIKLTRLDGSEVYLNPDLIETIEETPDTHITLSNGKSYLFLEPAKVVIGRIVSYRARLLRLACSSASKKYLGRRDPDRYQPLCAL